MNSEMIIVIAAIYAGACGFYSATVARAKGYDNLLWFLGGAVFGIIALIAIAGMPELVEEDDADEKRSWTCPKCGGTNRADTYACEHCKYSLIDIPPDKK